MSFAPGSVGVGRVAELFALVDSGASHSFVSVATVQRF